MATVYICMDRNSNSGVGKSLVDAWNKYEGEFGDYGVSSLKFYRAEEVAVELVEKPVMVKTPVAKKAAKN